MRVTVGIEHVTVGIEQVTFGTKKVTVGIEQGRNHYGISMENTPNNEPTLAIALIQQLPSPVAFRSKHLNPWNDSDGNTSEKKACYTVKTRTRPDSPRSLAFSCERGRPRIPLAFSEYL